MKGGGRREFLCCPFCGALTISDRISARQFRAIHTGGGCEVVHVREVFTQSEEEEMNYKICDCGVNEIAAERDALKAENAELQKDVRYCMEKKQQAEQRGRERGATDLLRLLDEQGCLDGMNLTEEEILRLFRERTAREGEKK